MPAYNYIAVDPGKMSGVAVLYVNGAFSNWEFEWPNVNRVVEKFALTCHQNEQPLRIVGERFDQLGKRGRQDDLAWSLKILGCWENEAARYGYGYQEHGRSETKSFISNDMLRKMGWWLTAGDGHANDAARVLGRDLSISDPTYWRELVLGSDLLG